MCQVLQAEGPGAPRPEDGDGKWQGMVCSYQLYWVPAAAVTKPHMLGGLEPKIAYLPALRTRFMRSQSWQGRFPLEARRAQTVQAPLPASGGCWPFLVCLGFCASLLSVPLFLYDLFCVCVQISLLIACRPGCRSHPNPL